MLTKNNCLSKNNYCITTELHDALINEKCPQNNIPGPYLIFMKTLNKDNLFIIIFVIMTCLHLLYLSFYLIDEDIIASFLLNGVNILLQ